MFDNIICLGSHWVCELDEPSYEGNNLIYTGDFDDGVATADCAADWLW